MDMVEKVCVKCDSKRIYFRKWTQEWVCYNCGAIWIPEEDRRDNEKMAYFLDKIIRKRGDYMAQPRYLQINESVKAFGAGSDKTILDDIMKILNKHGRFQVVRDSLVFTIIENKDWKPPIKKIEIKPPSPFPGKTLKIESETTSSHSAGGG